jgi:hypothetical protein
VNTVKLFYAKYVKRWVKAIASAVGGAIAGLLLNLVHGETPWPSNQQEWITLLMATVLPAVFALFSPPNKITQKQLDKDPNVIGGVVMPDRPLGIPGATGTVLPTPDNWPAGEYPRPWPKP